MTKSIVNKAKKPSPKVAKKDEKNRERLKTAEYLAFIEWISLPIFERTLKTQGDFAKKYKVNEATLSKWKDRKGFWDRVDKARRNKWREKTSTLLGSHYAKMLKYPKPFGKDLMVWLQYVEKFNPKMLFEDETPNVLPMEAKEAIKKALMNSGLQALMEEDDEDQS